MTLDADKYASSHLNSGASWKSTVQVPEIKTRLRKPSLFRSSLRGCTKSANLRRSSRLQVFITHIATYFTQGYLMTRHSYPSYLTLEECQLLEPEMPALKTGARPRSVTWREIVNGILFVLRMVRGVPNAVCRKICPPVQQSTLVFGCGIGMPFGRARMTNCGIRRAICPGVGMIDIQSVKAAEQGGTEDTISAKKVKVSRRYIVVGTQGWLPVVAEDPRVTRTRWSQPGAAADGGPVS